MPPAHVLMLGVPRVTIAVPRVCLVEILSLACNVRCFLLETAARARFGSLNVIRPIFRVRIRKDCVTVCPLTVSETLPVQKLLPNAALHFRDTVTFIPGLTCTVAGGTWMHTLPCVVACFRPPGVAGRLAGPGMFAWPGFGAGPYGTVTMTGPVGSAGHAASAV